MGIIDTGFAPSHQDLSLQIDPQNPNSPDDHGTHVAGIVGATFNNSPGVDGVNPAVSIIALPLRYVNPRLPPFQWARSTGSAMIQDFQYMIQNHSPPVRVVNMSLGYNWSQFPGVDPTNPVRPESPPNPNLDNANCIARGQGQMFYQINSSLLQGRDSSSWSLHGMMVRTGHNTIPPWQTQALSGALIPPQQHPRGGSHADVRGNWICPRLFFKLGRTYFCTGS